WLPEKDILGNEIFFWDDPMLVGGLDSCNQQAACNAHDIGYGTCGAQQPQVDTAFRNAMYANCASCYPNSNPVELYYYAQCIAFAEAFYRTVDTVGHNFYAPAQEEACECKECPAGRSGGRSLPPWLAADSDIWASALNADEVLTGLTYFAAVNLDTGAVQRGEAGSNGIAFEQDIILAPQARYRLYLLHAETLHEDYMDIVTPVSGEALELPSFYVTDNLGFDLDEDGLGALGELVMGTSAFDSDSDDDGVLDGAEVQTGQDPLSGVLVKTGIIGSADTPGNAQDICTSGDVIAVADGDAGVAIFNVFAGMNPQLVAQVETPGSATTVACDGNRVAVAASGAGSGAGLVIVNFTTPAAAAVTQQVTFDGATVRSLVAANGKAYAGLSDGRVARVDMASGAVEASIPLNTNARAGSPVQALALAEDFLYAQAFDGLYPIYTANFTTTRRVPVYVGEVPLEHNQRLTGGNQRLVGSQDTFATQYDLGLPIWPDETIGSTTNFVLQIVPNGAGMGVAATTTFPGAPADQHRVMLFDTSVLTEEIAYLGEFTTPGAAVALVLDKGLAYVAAGDAGVQVINYQPADTRGITPTVTLSSNFSDARFQSDAEMRLTAHAQDDVAVRDVEFYLNGSLLQKDSSFPFEIRFTPPVTTTLTLQAKATDTGGKFAWTDIQTRTAVADAIQPEVVNFAPPLRARIFQNELLVQASFSEGMDPASLTPASFQLLDASSVAVGGGAVTYEPISQTASLRFDPPPVPGEYRVVLNSSVTDSAGNPLPRRSWPITVLEALDGAFFTFSDNPASSIFSAIDMDGDWMVVGASQAQIGDNANQGAAYLFTKDPNTASGWREVKKLTGSDGTAGDEFGRAVSISGDTVVVGAPAKQLQSRSQGQVYVYARNQGGPDNWGEVTRFADAVGSFRLFGLEVEAVGNTFVVIPTTVLKTAYIYRRSTAGATDWALIKEVELDDSFGQNFGAGEAIALSADEKTLIASVPRLSHDENKLNEGVVRIFEQDAGGPNNWGQTGQIQASDAAEDAYFGGDVALNGEILVVGSPFYDTSQELNATGRFYIFRKDGTAPQGWREIGIFTEPDTLTRVRVLGGVVAATPNLVIATGAMQVYVYQPVNGNLEEWSRTRLWTAENEPAADAFNGIVAVDGSSVATLASLNETGAPAVFLLQVAR
ncbi:MAG: Ig-like domain-containing protein, partial [Caldilineaceae bacterium]